MTVRIVDAGHYATIYDAVAASRPGDIIKVPAGYVGGDAVNVSVDNLTFDIADGVPDVLLFANPGVSTIRNVGSAPLFIYGEDGANTLYGGSGDDTIDGGLGSDTLIGGEGDDLLRSSSGSDSLLGGSGDDYVVLTVQRDAAGTVDGGAGVDTVEASTYFGDYTFRDVEVLVTGGGTASIAQLSEFETITWVGFAEDNRHTFQLTGQGGEIDFSTRLHGADAITVSAGLATSGVKVTGTANADAFAGSRYADMLIGGEGADRFTVTPGADSLDGGAGADVFSASNIFAEGVIDGGAGIDTLDIQSGENYATDVSSVTLRSVETIDGGDYLATVAQLAGVKTLTTTKDPSGDIRIHLTGEGGALDLTGKVAAGKTVSIDAAYATSAVSITASGGADYLAGSGHDDVLNGGGGNDTLRGTYGLDTLRGGEGSDLIDFAEAFPNSGGLIDGGAGADTLRSFDLRGYTITGVETLETRGVVATAAQLMGFTKIIDTYDAHERISFDLVGAGGSIDFGVRVEAGHAIGVFADGATAGVTVTGTTLGDQIYGSTFADVLIGGAGADTMGGGLGNDTYYVDSSRDVVIEAANGGADRVKASVSHALAANVESLTLTGSAISGVGNSLANVIQGANAMNILDGGLGNDTLTGAAGADRFTFSTALGASNVDTITDFSHRDDTIRIDDAAFKGLVVGNLTADAFWSGAGVTMAHDATDRIIYDTGSGALFFDRDGVGTQFSAVKFAVLTGSPDDVAFDDFVVV